MRILLGTLLLAAAAWAVPDEGHDREMAAAKERLQAMLDEAALLEQAGRPEDAARVREEAAGLKRKIAEAQGGGKEERDDPRVQALHNLEKAIGALDKAGYERMAGELRGMADRLRMEIKGARGQEGPDADFWRRNLDTMKIAMKGLAEADRHDAADLMERAIHARQLMLEGKPDRAEEAMKEGPGDADLVKLLLTAAGCWREFKQPEKAAQCEELGRFFQHRIERTRVEKTLKFARGQEGPGPEDRMARLEERLDRMEKMLHEAFARLEERERERDRDRERDAR